MTAVLVIASVVLLVLFCFGLVAALVNSYNNGVIIGRKLKYCPSCRCGFCLKARRKEKSETFNSSRH